MAQALTRTPEPARTAVLVVDMQNDFCSPDGAMAALGHDIAPNTAILEPLAAFLAGARSAGAKVVHVHQWASEDTASPARRARAATMGRTATTVCEAGTWGAEIHPLVAPTADDLVVRKFRYSGFVSTNLEMVLRAQGIDTVVVTGTAANVCVDSTARDAYMRDFHVLVPTDLVGHTRADLAAPALANLAAYFADLTTADDLLAAWAPLP